MDGNAAAIALLIIPTIWLGLKYARERSIRRAEERRARKSRG